MKTGVSLDVSVDIDDQRAPPGSAEKPLVVTGICKQYRGGVRANEDISFEVEPGEILGILGPNGAGKTTLVRQITTELMPTSGSIRVFGVDVVAEPIKVKYMMGIVPQEGTLYPSMTVRQTFRIFGKLRGLTSRDARARADDLIADLRLEEHRDVISENLSGGLRRRVLVGIAALGNPGTDRDGRADHGTRSPGS